MDPLSASSLSGTIQLAVAPVFLLTAIGAFLSVMTTRLGRAIDRARLLEAAISDDPQQRAMTIADLAVLDRRMLLANRAVGLAVASALTVCILIATLFIDAVSPFHPNKFIPGLFILAITLLIASLTAFALEIRISIRTVRVSAHLLRATPKPASNWVRPSPNLDTTPPQANKARPQEEHAP